jgi:hypothetical protein
MGGSISYTHWLKAQVPINDAVKENKKRLSKFNVSFCNFGDINFKLFFRPSISHKPTLAFVNP